MVIRLGLILILGLGLSSLFVLGLLIGLETWMAPLGGLGIEHTYKRLLQVTR